MAAKSTIANPGRNEEQEKKFGPERARSQPAAQNAMFLNNFSGKVVDRQNNAIPYATITTNNRNQVVAADKNGFFQFTNEDSIAKVSIASIGYREKNVTLNSKQAGLNIILTPDDKKLEEVVVSGYGKAQKSARAQPNSMDASPVTGWNEFNRYLDSNKKFPPAEPRLSGEVVVSFKLNQKEELSAFTIEKSMGKFYDEEAIRLIKEGPAWKLNKGKKTRVKVAIHF